MESLKYRAEKFFIDTPSMAELHHCEICISYCSASEPMCTYIAHEPMYMYKLTFNLRPKKPYVFILLNHEIGS